MSLLRKIINHRRCKKLKSCGEKVWIGKNCTLNGNIEVGSDVVIGQGAYFISTQARLLIHDHVVFGPNVTIYTGDHATDIVGKHIIEITDEDKKKQHGIYDKDVVIEAGCWIGTRAIILKGVTIGRGSVIGAGAIVTKDVPPYTVYVGVPSVKCMSRFSESQILQHEKMLEDRGIVIR